MNHVPEKNTSARLNAEEMKRSSTNAVDIHSSDPNTRDDMESHFDTLSYAKRYNDGL